MGIDYTDLIEYMLSKLDVNYTPVIRDGTMYFTCQNPLVEDNVNSFQIFTDGWCVSYNCNIDNKNRISIKDLCKKIGFTQEYIEFVLRYNHISIIKINQYKEILIKKQLKEKYDYKKYKELRDLFNSLFIAQSDVLGMNEIKNVSVNKFNVNKKKRKKSSMVEVEPIEEQINKCKEYLNNRKLDFIDGLLEPCVLQFDSGHQLPVIAIRSDYQHTKYRNIDGDSKLRYLSQGKYKKPLTVINKNNKVAVLCEGEFESIVFSKFAKNVDVYALHNTNSIGDLTGFEKYDKIIVLIDNNTFKKVMEGVKKSIKNQIESEVVILPKYTEDNKTDFNDLFINDEERLQVIIKNILEEV